MCRMPFGSGGNRVTTRPPVNLRCAAMSWCVSGVTMYPSVL